VRNIAYDSTEENLRKKFSEYGEVNYFLVTKDRHTGEPRGTGFVQFKTQEAAQFCLESAYQSKQFHAKQKKGKKNREKRAEESDIMIDGRRLVITLAVSPDESTKITQKKKDDKKKPEDPRNLHLAEIGVIKPNSEEAKALPAIDYQKRLASWRDKKLKLANPNFHVNKFRLSVRGIPKETTESQLKQVFIKAARQGAAKDLDTHIKQVKIVRDRNAPQVNGESQSTGFGFVEFFVHEAALNALHNTNNITGIFTQNANRRLIVEFAVDNVKMLQKRNDKLLKQAHAREMKQNTELHDTSRIDKSPQNNYNKQTKKPEKFTKGQHQNKNSQKPKQNKTLTRSNSQGSQSQNQNRNVKKNQNTNKNSKNKNTNTPPQQTKKRKRADSVDEQQVKKHRRVSVHKKLESKEKHLDHLVRAYTGITRRPSKKWDQ